LRCIENDDIGYECYTNVGIINRDGQTSVPEAAVLGGEFETGPAFLAWAAVYTVRFEGVVFVLHIFQKKSTRGPATPKADIDLIRERLKVAGQIAKELSR